MKYGHAQALRAIATICCIADSIHELEKADGIQCLTDILADRSVPEVVRSEAAGVVAQITSPCLEQFHHLAGFIENMEDLVHSLTGTSLLLLLNFLFSLCLLWSVMYGIVEGKFDKIKYVTIL